MKRLMTMAGMFILALGLGACNTMKGAGQDIERGGEKIQGAASDAQHNMSSGSSDSSRSSGSSKGSSGSSSKSSGSGESGGTSSSDTSGSSR
jgi:predicted small secreted protein